MRITRRPLAAALAMAITATFGVAGLAPADAATRPAAGSEVLIPYEEFTLPNGLRVVVHTDRKAPIVAVNIWYHVGSKDEPAGRSGFAHLFEHLMFNGSENHRGEYFEPFELVGATDMNGTTWLDRTNYFQNVPTTALDLALWMESDRMGHLLGAIDQKVLDEQRGVVQNEKRQGENQPYGQADDLIYRALYPKDHPYHHSTIGSMNDLNAASLEDVKQWFRAWYGPNNAVLVLAGDIDVKTAREKVTRYFGHIPAGPTLERIQAGPVKRATTRETMEDKVPQARIYRAWSVEQYGKPDLERLQLLAQVLGGSRGSRLDRRLVFEDKLADKVSAYVLPFELASTFYVTADVRQGVDPAQVEKALDEEIARLLAEGPTAEELGQAKIMTKASVVRGIERIGGFGGKADALAECAVYTGNPGCFRDALEVVANATVEEVREAGRTWLGEGSHTLVVLPGERQALAEEPSPTPEPFKLPPPDRKYRALKPQVDRSKGVPMPDRFPDLKFPALERATLSNGTQVILARRDAVPVVQLSYEFKGGFAADLGRKLGTSSFTMAMLDEGAGELDALGFANRAESLGAVLGAGATLDGGNAYLSALKENLDASLQLFADMVRRPRFEQKEIERVRATWLAGIAQEKARPNGAAMRVLPPLLYGQGHPYAIPFSGTGTEESIASLTREDLQSFHAQWVRPDGATLIVVGDTTLEEIVPLLERHFGDWKAAAPAPAAVEAIPEVERPQAAAVYLIDQPGAVQATILAGQVVPSTKDPSTIVFDFANSVLGGEFSSRLNMNLREDKHWAYGAYSFTTQALGQRPWMAFAPVQIDKTAEALAELDREVREYVGGRKPPTPAEVAKIQATEIRSLPGAYETARAVLGTIGGIVRYDRPDDWVFRRKARIEALTVEQVQQAAATLDPDKLVWVVVGDLKQVEQPVRALKLGPVHVIDADGRPVAR
ncbi:insulinase family protein [Pseudoxanthomonas sp. SGNA-20]|uniref:M16 family metallopeptidase n=1 Tax=unclassified Pseudoxanthomonas TaxID=2645906 RepID=UPI00040B0051|nr:MULTISPECIES: pitrilysin family protein [unclassified Pseudoxanthomonas]RRN59271.1 insulinase family protein [Pseudoxanthomonas sp. SGNA-20]RRN78946.1 insulinase family protein [Pseudoxanthomonas sp. SGD-10]